jgi:putative colanic acid biosynthesis acetyltransferase WcaF
MQLERSAHRWPLRHKVRRLAWIVVWGTLGRPGPRFLSAWRVLLLRLFGAKIGRATLICGHVSVLMPWNLEIGEAVAIAEGVNLYNFAKISVGSNSCISQGSWLCTGTHDYLRPDFPLQWKPIRVGSSVWIAAEAFVHPGVSIEDGAVVGARSVVTSDLAAWSVFAGNPCRFVKTRREVSRP